MNDSEKPPPSKLPLPSSDSSLDSGLRDVLDTRFKALTGALTGIEHEIRQSREDRATDGKLSRSGHEFTQGAIRAHRGETGRSLDELAVVRAQVSEILALLRAAPRVEALAVTNPGTRWEQAGWRLPTPHQVLWLLMSLSLAIPIVGLAPTGSLAAKLCELLAFLCGSKGIELARNFVSPQLRAKADAFDAHAMKELSEGGHRP